MSVLTPIFLGGGIGKNNPTATTGPTTADDITLGYSAGSIWVDVTHDIAYICVDATASAAIWIEITQVDPPGPDFTYNVGGELTQIDYDDGSQKIFSYNGNGDLTQLDYIRNGLTLRKQFFYTGGGDLDYITEFIV